MMTMVITSLVFVNAIVYLGISQQNYVLTIGPNTFMYEHIGVSVLVLSMYFIVVGIFASLYANKAYYLAMLVGIVNIINGLLIYILTRPVNLLGIVFSCDYFSISKVYLLTEKFIWLLKATGEKADYLALHKTLIPWDQLQCEQHFLDFLHHYVIPSVDKPTQSYFWFYIGAGAAVCLLVGLSFYFFRAPISKGLTITETKLHQIIDAQIDTKAAQLAKSVNVASANPLPLTAHVSEDVLTLQTMVLKTGTLLTQTRGEMKALHKVTFEAVRDLYALQGYLLIHFGSVWTPVMKTALPLFPKPERHREYFVDRISQMNAHWLDN